MLLRVDIELEKNEKVNEEDPSELEWVVQGIGVPRNEWNRLG